jgi:uncharacterized protein (TIGR03435 family)
MQRNAIAALTAIGLFNALAVRAQAPTVPAASLNFEVASLKPSLPGGRGGIRPAPGGERYLATNLSLRQLITEAFRVKADQVAGGPEWIDTELYDMNAKAARPSSVEELHIMLRNLLADRFKFQVHRESKEMPVYTLTVDTNGPKMQAHEAASAADPWIDEINEKPLHLKWSAKFVPMDYFAWRLSQILDRPVLDQTKLKGGYDFELAFTREPPPALAREGARLNGELVDLSGPTIFEAVRRQLGLKLERQKGPVDIMVIDHVEKPAEN